MFKRGPLGTKEQSMKEMANLLERNGAAAVFWIDTDVRIGVEFTLEMRRLRLTCGLPSRYDTGLDKNARRMGDAQSELVHQRIIRRRWRVMVLVLKAKLISVSNGIEVVEQAFMGQLVLANNRTMSQVVLPQIESGALALQKTGGE